MANGSSFRVLQGNYNIYIYDRPLVFLLLYLLNLIPFRYNYATSEISTDVAEQTEQTMQNINAALKEAGASMEDVVRVHYILPDKKQFPLCWPVLQKWFGTSRPACTMIQAELLSDDMKIEIEVTAMMTKESQD